MIDFTQHKILVCAGSGGVGKTTVAASLGVAAAQSGMSVLVLTIDPARRLANALGLGSGDIFEATKVPDQNFAGELYAMMVEPQAVFDEFIRRSAPNKDVTEKLLSNTLYRQLSTTLSGSQEFTSLELLLTAHQSDQYDLIILDTPPAQHAIDFLRSPEKIYSLFQKSITQWFIRTDSENQGFLKKVFNKGTRLALDALERITGEGFITELSGFFENMAELQKTVSERSLMVHQLLSAPETGFVLVTAIDEAKLSEAELFNRDLQHTGARLSYLVVNRTFPLWAVPVTLQNLDGSRREVGEALNEFYQKVKSYYGKKDEHVLKLSHALGGGLPVFQIPELDEEVVGLKGLERLAQLIVPYKGVENE